MASHSRLSVNTGAAQLLYANPPGGSMARVWVTNRGTVVVTLGADSTVTTSTGHDLAANQTIGPLEVQSGDELYVATGTNAQSIHVIAT
jgi:hypothetical protein